MKQTLIYSSGQTKINYTLINILLLSIIFFLLALLVIRIQNLFPAKQLVTNLYQGYKIFTPKYYFGVDVDISQLLPGSKNYVVNKQGEDLIDIAAKLGINMFRIMNYSSTSKYAYTPAEWDRVLRKMNSKGIKAIILVETSATNNPHHYTDDLSDIYLSFVKDYVLAPDLCNNPDVFAIDLKNEPSLQPEYLKRLETASQMIKKQCPKMLVTVGGWKTDTGEKDNLGQTIYNWNDPKDSGLLRNVVDFYAVHLYGFDRKVNGIYPDPYRFTSDYLKRIKQYGGNKPIFIDEFGAGNGQAITDQTTLGSKELQKDVYTGVLQTAYTQHIMGATAYIFYPRSDHPEGWAILENNGNTIFPAAYTFASFTNSSASAENSSHSLPSSALPQEQILTQTDNHKTFFIDRGDSIGIHLPLDWKKTYTLVLNNHTPLSISEPLTKGYTAGIYDAVLHANVRGTTRLEIKQKDNQTTVFRVTVTVE